MWFLIVFLLLSFPWIAEAAQAEETLTPPVIIQSEQLQYAPQAGQLVLRGTVSLRYQNFHIRADEVQLDMETGDGTAQGHIFFTDGESQIEGETVTFNLFTKTGKLVHVQGRLVDAFQVKAGEVKKLGENRFEIIQGVVTTCNCPEGGTPTWEFRVGKATVVKEGYATIRHFTFVIKGIPVFYFPYFFYPVKLERATGFLPPRFGTSSRDGFFVENRFFWAFHEQADATIGLDYLTKKGLRPSGEVRYILGTGSKGELSGTYIRDQDLDLDFWKVDTFQEQELPGQGRGLLRLDLLSRASYDREFAEDLFLRSRRYTNSFLTLTKSWENQWLHLQGEWLQDTENRQDETLASIPELAYGYEPQRIFTTPLFFRFDGSIVHFRQKVDDHSRYRGRFSAVPQLLWPISFSPAFSITPLLNLQQNIYLNEEKAPDSLLSRTLFQVGFDIDGPRFFGFFTPFWAGEGSRWKHVIEPRWRFRYTPPLDDKPVTIFDPFDLVPSEQQLEVGITNRFLRRGDQGKGPQEAVRLIVKQIYGASPSLWALAVEGEVFFAPFLSIDAELRYNIQTNAFDAANISFQVRPLPWWRFFIVERFRNSSTFDLLTEDTLFQLDAPNIGFLTGGTVLDLGWQWQLEYRGRYNYEEGEVEEHSIGIRYLSTCRCWGFRFRFQQLDNDDTRFGFQVTLEGFRTPEFFRTDL